MAIQIKHFGKNDDFTLLGNTFHGIGDLEAYIELSTYDTSSSFPISDVDKKNPKKTGNVHVGELWAPYPRFDDDDAENRYFRNFLVRKHPITEDDMRRLFNLPRQDNNKRITDNIPDDMLPIVYYDDEHEVIIAVKQLETN